MEAPARLSLAIFNHLQYLKLLFSFTFPEIFIPQ